MSEIFFFSGFFWAFFHLAGHSSAQLGDCWPSILLDPVEAYGIPLFNTFLLLSSGLRVTWRHHSLMSGDFKAALGSLGLTVLLGTVFLSFQMYEYYVIPYTLRDSAYYSCFFMLTGFHGFHVFVGRLMLAARSYRINSGYFRPESHGLFEASIWYWHFVDVVWLILFVFVYWATFC